MKKSRGILIAGNWKMNHRIHETAQYLLDLQRLWGTNLKPSTSQALQEGRLKACLIPPFLSLQQAVDVSRRAPTQAVFIAAQNAHWEKLGAYTGEISGPMLQEIGISTVLIGHSERRQYFGETDKTVRLRARSLLEQGFTIILCIGETRAQREAGETNAVLTKQLQAVFEDTQKGVAQFFNGRVILAYEPIWAIGTGLTATPEQAKQAHHLIRKYLKENLTPEAAEQTPILYGGSVTPKSISDLLACSNIDGALVGGASLKVEDFLALIEAGGQALID
jgi:triosephosphate isomerase (TIM)